MSVTISGHIENADMMFMDFAMALLLLPNTGDYFPIDKFRSGKCLLEMHIQCLVNIALAYYTSIVRMLSLRVELIFTKKKNVPCFGSQRIRRNFFTINT